MNDQTAAQFIEAARMLSGRLTELSEITRGLMVNHVVGAGTRTIPASGVIQLDFAVPIASVMVGAVSAAADVIVSPGPPSTDSGPATGPGVLRLRPGAWECTPITSNAFSVWGTAGDIVYIAAYTRPQPPFVSAPEPPVTPVTVPGSSGLVVATPAIYRGFALRETAGAAAVVRFRDGTATGQVLDVVALAAAESARELYPGGTPAAVGIFYELVSGTVEGVVRRAGGG